MNYDLVNRLRMILHHAETSCLYITGMRVMRTESALETLPEAIEHIEKLEAQVKEDAMQYLSDTGQMGDTIDDLTRRHNRALHKIDVLEDQIEEIMRALEITDKWMTDLDMYANPDHHLAPSLQHVRDTYKKFKVSK